MALEHPSAPSRASSGLPAGTPRSGVVHVNVRHADRYTVIGNHLAQHRSLSLTARGLAVYIQSLPPGSPIGIKRLAERVPEGEVRIAAALRELEEHGYLERRRARLDSGRVVTRTYSYNNPGAGADEPPPPLPPDGNRDPGPEPDPDPGPAPAPDPAPDPGPGSGSGPRTGPGPGPRTGSDPEPGCSGSAFDPGPGSGPSPAPDARLLQAAADLLAGLRRRDPRLLLAERDVQRLAPGLAAWLERGADPESVGRTLAASLPEPLHSPAALISHRIAALLPARMPVLPRRPVFIPPDPFQTCDGCERAFRSPHPGRCRDCPPAHQAAAA